MANRSIRHVPWLVWVLIISVLSFLPGNQIPEIKFDLIAIDKLVHFGMYFVLSMLLLYGFTNKTNFFEWRLYLLLILSSILFGLFTELIQGAYINRRFFDWDDFVANSIGTVFGAVTFRWIGRKLIKN